MQKNIVAIIYDVFMHVLSWNMKLIWISLGEASGRYKATDDQTKFFPIIRNPSTST